MLAKGIDTVVLGCTHYPFVIPLIQEIVGPGVRVIDPAPAVARQVGRLLGRDEPVPFEGTGSSPLRFYTSGKREDLERFLPLVLSESGPVRTVFWDGGGVNFASNAG